MSAIRRFSGDVARDARQYLDTHLPKAWSAGGGCDARDHCDDPGEKASPGKPAFMATREDLSCDDASHRITFHFTPKHASWINQIEIWFSILVRKLLRRGNFTSKAHLKQRIEAFIAYFNQTMAKPFRWTMKGRPLTV